MRGDREGTELDARVIIALTIFMVTYALISFGRLTRGRIDMPAAAMIGGTLMLLTGAVTAQEAIVSIQWQTILIILGMMLIASSLESVGFFTFVAGILARRARTPHLLMVYLSLITAFLSALILNDAVVLIFTPVVIHSARRMNVSSIPFLAMEAISANIGSTATEVGNPQNAYIATISQIGFHLFTAYLIIPTLISLAIAICIALAISGRQMDGNVLATPPADQPRISIRTVPMAFMMFVVFSVFVGFYTSSFTGIPLYAVALIGGSFSYFSVPLLTDKRGRDVLLEVDWGILLFFLGLFILIAGVESSGLISLIIAFFQHITGGAVGTVGGMTLISAILSNLVSNVPAVLLLSPFVSAHPSVRLWLALAASSTLAGNGTILGAAANVIVARGAAREGVEMRLTQFARYGLPITLLSLLLLVLLL